MSHTAADLGFFGYKNWRKAVNILPIGTVLTWQIDYTGSTIRNSISAGQSVIIESVESAEIAGDCIYTLRLLKGKRTFYWRAEGIARKIIDNEITIDSEAQ